MYDAAEKGVPVLDEKARVRFNALPTHAQQLFFAAAKAGTLSGGTHLAALLSLDLDDRKVELVLADNCFLCHSNPDLPDEILFRRREKTDPLRHLDIREVVADVHFRGGLMCAGCHGGKPTDDGDVAGHREALAVVRGPPQGPHLDPGVLRALPLLERVHARATTRRCPSTSSLKYQDEPKHGQLLLGEEGLEGRAVRELPRRARHPRAQEPNSLVYRENIPATCGRCHADAAYMKGYTKDDGKTPLPTNQLEQYRKSVHGKALLGKHDAGAPACNSCHGNHAALPPQVAFVSQVCRTCHAANGSLFDGSPHKKAFEKHGWPECETCHGKHDIARPTDEMLSDDPKGLCHACHAKLRRAEVRRDGEVLLRVDRDAPDVARDSEPRRRPARRARVRRGRAEASSRAP